jgi:hypothetical protein
MPPIPMMSLSDGTGTIFILTQVVESRDIPPLPVSRIKLSVSGYPSSLTLITATPPVKVVKGIWVRNLECPATAVFCAGADMQNKREKISKLKNLRHTAHGIGRLVWLLLFIAIKMAASVSRTG